MATWVPTDPPGRLADYAHAALVLGQLKDALKAAQAASVPTAAVWELREAQRCCEQFWEIVYVLGPEADYLEAILHLSFSSRAHRSRDGFMKAIAANGAARAAEIKVLLSQVGDCLLALRKARNAVAFPKPVVIQPPPP